MAHFRQQRGRWRVEIERLGVRKSRTFPTREQAEAWATTAEPAVIERQRRRQAFADTTLLNLVPKRVMAALASVEYTKQEIARAAIHIGQSCGVYFLLFEDEIVYVGQTIDLLGRLYKHRRDGREFDAFAFMPCSREKLNATEAAYITAFVPSLNTSLGRRNKVVSEIATD